jgi:formylglycine-generating enzyme required for sulfatase activity
MRMIGVIAVSAVLFLTSASRAQPTRPAAKPTLPKEKLSIPASPIKLDLVQIPEGTFLNKGGQKVKIKPLWISTTELTWDAYDPWRLMSDIDDDDEKKDIRGVSRPSTPYEDPTCGFGTEGFPAINIHPAAARAYCQWLSQKTGKKFRLPTEDEWEYACRAGADGPKTLDDLKKDAWLSENSKEQTHETAMRRANAWGLYDMLGNAAEWATSPDGPILCGGSFKDEAKDVSPIKRQPNDPDILQLRDPEVPKSHWWLSDGPQAGFRIVRED